MTNVLSETVATAPRQAYLARHSGMLALRRLGGVRGMENALLDKDLARAICRGFARVMDRFDPGTAHHHRQVAYLAACIGAELGLEDDEIEGIRLAAGLHDLGKIGVPRVVLEERGGLGIAELHHLQTHSAIGYDLLHEFAFPWPIATLVHQHHERLDGSGFPGGLAGEAILPGARVIAVADVLEAMVNPRPYRATPGLADGLAELRRGGGGPYDAMVVEACLAVCERDPFAACHETRLVAPDLDTAAPSMASDAPHTRLTSQQQLVMRLLADGQSNKEIARTLHLGVGTVKVHLLRAYATLGVHNRVAAVQMFHHGRDS